MTRGKQKSEALIAHLVMDDGVLPESRLPDSHAVLADGLMVDRLYHSSWSARYLPMVALFGLFVLFRDYIGWIAVLALTALYALGTGWLDLQRRNHADDDDRLFRPVYWGKRFALGSALTGMTWGLAAWLLLPVPSPELRLVPVLLWSGLLLSSFGGRVYHLTSYYAFMLASSLPLFARGLMLHEPEMLFVLLLALTLVTGVTLRIHAANRRERSGIAGRLRNAELLAQIDSDRSDLRLARETAERALADLLEDLRQIESLAQFGRWSWSGTAQRAEWSAQFLALSGLALGNGNATLEVILQRLHGDDQAEAVRFFRDLRLQGEAQPALVRVKQADGGFIRCRLLGRASPSASESGLFDIQGILQRLAD